MALWFFNGIESPTRIEESRINVMWSAVESEIVSTPDASVKVAGRLFRGYLHLSALISHISSDNLVI